MKELWEQAILPYNLPLTIALGAVVLFWLVSLLGVLGVDSLDVEVPDDASADAGHLGHVPGAMLRFVNAGHVPLTVVLSVLVLAMWLVSIMVNYYFNPAGSYLLAAAYFLVAFVCGVVATKILTQPLVPLMRRLKQAEDAVPVIGETGVVRSIEITESYGQVEVHRADGAPAILNARLAEGSEPLPRGTQIVVLSLDESRGAYLVRPLPALSPDILP